MRAEHCCRPALHAVRHRLLLCLFCLASSLLCLLRIATILLHNAAVLLCPSCVTIFFIVQVGHHRHPIMHDVVIILLCLL